MQPQSRGPFLEEIVADLQERVRVLTKEVAELRAGRPEEERPVKIPEFLAQHGKTVTEGQLRSLIFRREQNGLASSGAIKKLGRTWEIYPGRFFRWFDLWGGR